MYIRTIHIFSFTYMLNALFNFRAYHLVYYFIRILFYIFVSIRRTCNDENKILQTKIQFI